MQQVQKGLRDCFVRFVHFRKRKSDYVNDKAGSLGRQLLAFVRGTQNALAQNDVPYMDITLEQNDMFNWGFQSHSASFTLSLCQRLTLSLPSMMVALEERVVTILAVMNQVNAYDQPGVQDGKLAADAVNALSKRVSSLVWPSHFSGTAVDFAHTVLRDADVNMLDLDGILSDLEGVCMCVCVRSMWPIIHAH